MFSPRYLVQTWMHVDDAIQACSAVQCENSENRNEYVMWEGIELKSCEYV